MGNSCLPKKVGKRGNPGLLTKPSNNKKINQQLTDNNQKNHYFFQHLRIPSRHFPRPLPLLRPRSLGGGSGVGAASTAGPGDLHGEHEWFPTIISLLGVDFQQRCLQMGLEYVYVSFMADRFAIDLGAKVKSCWVSRPEVNENIVQYVSKILLAKGYTESKD